MRITYFLIVAFLFLILNVSPVIAQQDNAALSEWSSQSLLGDRMRINAPVGTKREARQYSGIMGTAPDQEAKTRLRIPIEDTEMVIQAQLLYALAPTDMLGTMQRTKYFSSFEGALNEKNLDLRNGWSALVVFPEKYAYWPDSYLLALAWIKDPEGQLYEMMIGSWNSDVHYEQVANTANGIIESLHPGKNASTLPTGITTLDSDIALQNGDIELVVTLNGEHQISTQPGMSFVVHKITSLAVLGERKGQMGIYIGRYPSFDEEREILNGAKRFEDNERVLGQKPVWLVNRGEEWHEQDTLINVISGTSNLKVHIFISGPPKEVESLVAIAHTLKLRPKP